MGIRLLVYARTGEVLFADVKDIHQSSSHANVVFDCPAGSTAPIPAYRADAIQSVLILASELYAVQLAGSVSTSNQLEFLCQDYVPLSSSRLQPLGYDVGLIKRILCAAAGDAVPSLELILALSKEISTEIWIVQAIGAVTSHNGVQQLCDLINVEAADAIGLVGDLVKKDVCDAAAVANKVSASKKAESVTLTAPTVTPIAPVSKVVLPFVPVTH